MVVGGGGGQTSGTSLLPPKIMKGVAEPLSAFIEPCDPISVKFLFLG